MTHEAMAAPFTATLVCDDRQYAQQAMAAAWAELDRLDGLLSRFVESSDISRINVLDCGESTPVHVETFECLAIALDLFLQTEGAFDVAYRSRSPWSPRPRFELVESSFRIRVLERRICLDLGGIGKGFALDRMAAVLDEWGVANLLLAASTSTLLGNGKPEGVAAGWAVEFGSEGRRYKICLRNRALSGSGLAVRGEHIVDPRTGRRATRPFRAWASAPSAAVADALSTAFMVMSAEEVREYCRRHPTVEGWRQETPGDVAIGLSPTWAKP